MGTAEIEAFLGFLAVEKGVSASTQNQALNALVFLYRHVLVLDIGEFKSFPRARMREAIPVVFTPDEVNRIISVFEGTSRLVVMLLYGSGLRIGECLTLRVKDIDPASRQITVRDGKGRKDRIAILPQPCLELLQMQIEERRMLHQSDLARGLGRVPLPDALQRKYPAAEFSLAWQYLFPSRKCSLNRISGKLCRHHMSDTSIQRAFQHAMKKAQINKHAGPHNLRHSFATHLLLGGCDIRTLQKLLGHRHLKTTSVYLQIASDMKHVQSPLELLPIFSEEQKTEHSTNEPTALQPSAIEPAQKQNENEGIESSAKQGRGRLSESIHSALALLWRTPRYRNRRKTARHSSTN
jgi:integron integrase